MSQTQSKRRVNRTKRAKLNTQGFKTYKNFRLYIAETSEGGCSDTPTIDHSEDIQIYGTSNDKVFGLRNIKTKVEGDHLVLTAEIAGNTKEAKKYLKMLSGKGYIPDENMKYLDINREPKLTEALHTFYDGKGNMPIPYETFKKRIEEYNHLTTIKLPCGCSTNEVSWWTEAMWHLLFPDKCPTKSKKEKS